MEAVRRRGSTSPRPRKQNSELTTDVSDRLVFRQQALPQKPQLRCFFPQEGGWASSPTAGHPQELFSWVALLQTRPLCARCHGCQRGPFETPHHVDGTSLLSAANVTRSANRSHGRRVLGHPTFVTSGLGGGPVICGQSVHSRRSCTPGSPLSTAPCTLDTPPVTPCTPDIPRQWWEKGRAHLQSLSRFQQGEERHLRPSHSYSHSSSGDQYDENM